MAAVALSFNKLASSHAVTWSALGAMTVVAAIGCARAPTQQAEQATTTGDTNATTVTATQGDIKLLNVSYDVARDFYKDYNPKFVQEYANTHNGAKIDIQQSHGGSSKQALAVSNGLQADVVSMNQGSDIELLVKKGLVANDWQQQFPNNAVPYTSAVVFLVRQGNPKQIKDWTDLTKSGVQIVLANPKTTGNGRYAFLGAYGYGLHQFNNDDAKAQDFVKQLLKNVPVYENGGRAATTTFLQRQIGDVLVTFENEANLASKQFGQGQVEIVYPSYTVAAENPVAIVKTVSDKKGTTEAAKAYLDYLWSEPAQQLAADLYLRPSDANVLTKNADKLPTLNTFSPNAVFGSWDDIMAKYFKDGGVFDQLADPNSSVTPADTKK